ncbi:MAG TPA: hypothetical protein VM074_10485 [Solimonas sp.]|nr:hypothetical protein [Solimonas sp.]
MAESSSGSGNTGVVAVLAIFIIVVVAAFFAWQGGMFGGGHDTKVNVELKQPGS